MMDAITLEFIPVDAPAALPMKTTKAKHKPVASKCASELSEKDAALAGC